jgi:hypothetical protein
MQVHSLESLYSYPFIDREHVSKFLSAYLANTDKGSDVDLRSPLYGRETSREAIIAKTDDLLSRFSLSTKLTDLELKERGKIGPFSIRSPYSERKEGVHDYFKTPKFNPDAKSARIATAKLQALLPPRRLRPISLEHSVLNAPKNTNWGLPLLKKGSQYSSQYASLAATFYKTSSLVEYPCVLGWRGQAKGLNETPKQRVVWMFPHTTTLIEGMYAKPLVETLTRVLPSLFCAWISNEAVDEQITRILIRAKKDKRPVLSFDASAYDQSISGELTGIVFDAIRLWFDQSQSKMIAVVEHHFSTSGIVTPEGVIEGRQNCVPSGSGLTNLVDSLVNYWLYTYVCDQLGSTEGVCSVQGDDGVWYIPGQWSAGGISQILERVGISANPEKQYIDDSAVMYLQRLFELQGDKSVGVRSIYRTLSSMISYERMKSEWDKTYDSLRWITQLENCKHHPAFSKFVDFVQNGDKLRLGIGPDGFLSKKSYSLQGAKEALGYTSFPYGSEDISGLAKFATVQHLLSPTSTQPETVVEGPN